MAAFVFEVIVALLLVGAAMMCWRVDRRLKALRDGQDGLRDTVAGLNDAVDRARAALAALDRASRESSEVLEARTREARALADELRLLAGAGERGLERFERPRRSAPGRTAGTAQPASRPSEDLLKTLR
ncbi:DUF6468 domain-containing protein [Glycocaulis sp.]|uniref:DUF6468 domain-containing protein n=1 Tax=Glycocaulis sp. TaxID=1969725 RepID=UPI0025C31460|nr:DUF6468 domain-containing protein [Glycocaulis sp.]MCH8520419.1 DUF6468 domain-containing protein [Glycocaulis sp.]